MYTFSRPNRAFIHGSRSVPPMTLAAAAGADAEPLHMPPALAFLQAALCAAQCACWHSVEQYWARRHLLQVRVSSSRSDGPLRFWHLFRV